MAPTPRTLLQRLPAAQQLGRRQTQRALSLLEPRRLATGDVLFEQGTAPDHLALVLSGSLLVTAVLDDGSSLPLGRVRAGEVVGEMGLLDGAPRSGTVTCKRAGWLLLLSQARYQELEFDNDPLLPWLLDLAARSLAQRISVMTERIAEAAIDPRVLHALPTESSTRARSWWRWLNRAGQRP